MESPGIEPFGKYAINIEWKEDINHELHDHILDFENYLLINFKDIEFETVVTYHSMVLYFEQNSIQKELIQRLKAIKPADITRNKHKSSLWEIPVCYSSEFGIDQEHVAKSGHISIEELIQRHATNTYRIYFTGFLPGFLYLGGMDKSIACARKANPRLSIEAGSVGIAGGQTGIYPQNSPGGWQIIGRTPIQMFNPEDNPPSPFSAGDTLQFTPISLAEFNRIKNNKELNLPKRIKAKIK